MDDGRMTDDGPPEDPTSNTFHPGAVRMSLDEENVFSDTIERLNHARSLSNRPFNDRMVPYKNIGALLAKRGGLHPSRNFLTFYNEGRRESAYTYSQFE